MSDITTEIKNKKQAAKILVVEDNRDYRELLWNFLENAGYEVSACAEGAEAVSLAGKISFDLILLDLMLPTISGYEVCETIRKSQDVPIIMLTALDSEAHQLKGYDLLIDDYITKPVSMPLLIHKVEAVLRRTGERDPEIIEFAGISLNPKTHTVCVGGNPVSFTLKEFEILQELMKKEGEVVTRKSLIAKLWDYDFYGDTRIVDTHMKNIRKKLAEYDCIDTIRGVGYRLTKGNE